jgi:hypothetical protein
MRLAVRPDGVLSMQTRAAPVNCEPGRRTKHLAALFICLACANALAGPDLLYGSWEGGDTAAASIYGVLHISGTSIAWGRDARRPDCRTTYDLASEPAGVTFKNQTGKVFTTGPDTRFQTFLLKIHRRACTGALGYLRLTIDPGIGLRYLAMVEYSADFKEQGWMHFDKQ